METCFTGKTRIRTPSSRGFALLITITLLAFLVLLLVSIAGLTRVETQVAANGQKLAQARQSALMALNIAVGELQKYAGPDDRVTALSGLAASTTNPNITGVWSTGNTDADPAMWLVSGSETATSAGDVLASLGDPSEDLAPGSVSTDSDVFLVGDGSVSMKSQRVKVAKQPIHAPAGSVPGLGAGDTPKIGNYAWWVGDQGVKASLGLPDRHNEVAYGPWADVEARKRLRQQIGSGANYFRQAAGAAYGFDPLAAGNKALIANIQDYGQMALLTPSAGSDLPTYVKDHFHDFTAASYSVLANTEPASVAYHGLLQDLSMYPSALGNAFAAYADYSTYMAVPGEGELTRQYRMQPFTSATGSASGLPKIGFGVAPVISDLLLRFRVSRLNNNTVAVRSKLFVSLWNPYTSALVPEDMYLEIAGLPTVSLRDNSDNSPAYSFDLQSPNTIPPALLRLNADGTAKLRIKLTFDPSVANGSPEDKASWLPGRVYCWATGSDNSATLQFYTQDSQATNLTGWSYVNVPQPAGTHGILVSGPEVDSLTFTLLNAAGNVLAKSSGLSYLALNSGVNTGGWKFAYGFRIDQPNTTTKARSWHKQTADLRAIPVEKAQLIPFEHSGEADPASYNETIEPAGMSEYLIYRPMSGTGAQSTGHDVSLFELPRQPILSVGELQHLDLPGSKIFSIGNAWGSSANSGGAINANSLFDRFFFSGLMPGITGPNLAGGEPLPNWNMRVTDVTDIASVRSIGASSGYSSLHLLQGGGFNLNSTSAAAWRAMLSRIRLESTEPFTYVGTDSTTGASSGTLTDGLDQDSTLGTGIPAPVFFRFPQSAQETRDWSRVDGREIDTQAFRQGVRGGGNGDAMRGLTTTQIETLANQIVTLIKSHAATGPFRSISEFLNPSSVFGGAGLLEKAIANTDINPPELSPAGNVPGYSDPGFSSLTLTAADIMSGLAPFAKVRSDTFLVRTFGDTVNPVTGESEGRAYLEATVQRLPEPLAASDLASIQTQAQPSGIMGRRFKIISFRWLNESDI
jgi:hypothetical protein